MIDNYFVNFYSLPPSHTTYKMFHSLSWMIYQIYVMIIFVNKCSNTKKLYLKSSKFNKSSSFTLWNSVMYLQICMIHFPFSSSLVIHRRRRILSYTLTHNICLKSFFMHICRVHLFITQLVPIPKQSVQCIVQNVNKVTVNLWLKVYNFKRFLLALANTLY